MLFMKLISICYNCFEDYVINYLYKAIIIDIINKTLFYGK